MSAEDVFEKYYRAHSPAVLQFAYRRTRDLETARDICQETFAVAWQRFDPADPQPVVWLYNLAWNQVKKSHRYNRRVHSLQERLVLEAQSSDVDPRLELLAWVLGQLHERHREVLLMRYWDGLSAAEIGMILGMREAAVWQRLSRARSAARILFDGSTRGGHSG